MTSSTPTIAPMRRLEDPALITGKGQYVSDIRRAGMLYVSFVRSIYPHGPYRGAGRPEASFFIERTIETIATELGIDAVTVRKRNIIPPEAFPYKAATGVTYDSGAYAQALDLLLNKVNYEELRAEQARLRKQG